MAKDPTKRGKTVHEKEKDNTKFNNNIITTTTTTTTTTNKPTTITLNRTELEQNPEDYKSNHNNRCPE